MYTREVEQGGMLLSSDFDPIYGSTFTGGDTNDDNTSAVISTRGQFLRLVDSNGKILDDGIYFGNDTRIGSVQNIGHNNTFAVDFLLHYKRAVKIFAIVNNKLVERSQTENVRNGIGRLLIAPDNSTAVSVSGVGMGAVALTQPNDFTPDRLPKLRQKYLRHKQRWTLKHCLSPVLQPAVILFTPLPTQCHHSSSRILWTQLCVPRPTSIFHSMPPLLIRILKNVESAPYCAGDTARLDNEYIGGKTERTSAVVW